MKAPDEVLYVTFQNFSFKVAGQARVRSKIKISNIDYGFQDPTLSTPWRKIDQSPLKCTAMFKYYTSTDLS